MRRLLLALTIPLAGCDLLAGRPLAPEERCVWRTAGWLGPWDPTYH